MADGLARFGQRRVELLGRLPVRAHVAVAELVAVRVVDDAACTKVVTSEWLVDGADRLDTGGACELAHLGQLLVGIRTLSQHREDEPALGLRGP